MAKKDPHMTIEEYKKHITATGSYIHNDDIQTDLTYEPGNRINIGINDESCGSKHFVMGYTEMPPRTIVSRHFHDACDAGVYIISGTLVDCTGPDAVPHVCKAGTFIHIPSGLIHGGYNPSYKEPVRLVFTYTGVPNKEAGKFINIIENEGVYPPEKWIEIEEEQ